MLQYSKCEFYISYDFICSLSNMSKLTNGLVCYHKVIKQTDDEDSRIKIVDWIVIMH